MNLARVLNSYLAPASASHARAPSLGDLCLRRAAVYVTQCLYEFQEKQGGPGGAEERAGQAQEHMWDSVFPLLDHHFFRLVPHHMYECFLDYVLTALEVAGHFDSVGKELKHYIILFFPPHLLRFRAGRYADRVLMPTICCLHKCTTMEELYLEKADSACVTTYLLAHTLKHLKNLRVLSLPKQADDDVASIIGLNCPRLESLVLTGTAVTNSGLSWLLCCRSLHTVIMQGFFQGISPKGVALLLRGIPRLRHVVYDVMSDVLTYIDFNTADSVLPVFSLKTVLFHSMELLSSNHLELVTKLCPLVEWLSLDSALFYSLEGLGLLKCLSLLRLNYKSRPVDQTVVDFFSTSCQRLSTLHLVEVAELHLDDLRLTVGQCPLLETLVMSECAVSDDWDHILHSRDRRKPISESVKHLQLLSFQISPPQLTEFLSLFKGLVVLEMDQCPLELASLKVVLLAQPSLTTLRCLSWLHSTTLNLASLQTDFKAARLQLGHHTFTQDTEPGRARTLAADLLAGYADFSPVLPLDQDSR